MDVLSGWVDQAQAISRELAALVQRRGGRMVRATVSAPEPVPMGPLSTYVVSQLEKLGLSGVEVVPVRRTGMLRVLMVEFESEAGA